MKKWEKNAGWYVSNNNNNMSFFIVILGLVSVVIKGARVQYNKAFPSQLNIKLQSGIKPEISMLFQYKNNKLFYLHGALQHFNIHRLI